MAEEPKAQRSGPISGDPPSKQQEATPALSGIYSESSMPKSLVYAGIVVGLLLIFFGVGLLIFGKSSLLSSLMTCVGFGIVLASFGSKAGGAWAGWTATGAGAMAILLFLLLQHFTPSAPPIKKGQLRGDLSKISDIRIIDEIPLYEFRDQTTESIRFVILDKSLKSDRMSVQVDTTDKGRGLEFFELIGNSKLISDRYLSENSAAHKVIQWTLDYENRVIRDGQTVIFAEVDQLDENMLPKQAAKHASLQRWPAFVSSAFAQNQVASQQQDGTHSQNANEFERTNYLISALKSDDSSLRRNARDELVTFGPRAVEPMMTELRKNPTDYRLRGGVIYVLSTLITHNTNLKPDIAAALNNEDFPILVSAASDDDKTVRLQAAEFLYYLEDPRAVPYNIEAARNTSDNNKATNQILILGKSAQQFSTPERQSVINDLQKGPGPNNDILGNMGRLRRRLGF